MADTLLSDPNLPLGLNMYHLQVELGAVWWPIVLIVFLK